MNRIRNQQVAGSNPIAGSRKIKGLQSFWLCPFFVGKRRGSTRINMDIVHITGCACILGMRVTSPT